MERYPVKGPLTSFAMLVFSILILLISPLIVPGSGEEAEETRAEYADPEITLYFFQEVFYTTAEPDVVLSVEVTGTIICDLPEMAPDSLNCYVDVFFESHSWTPSESIHYFFNSENRETQFNCFYTPSRPVVPAGEIINISVRAFWNYPASRQSGEAKPSYSSIEVTSYGRVLLEPYVLDDPSRLVIDEKLEGRLEVKNRGNDDDIITLEVVSAPPNVEVVLEEERLVLDFWEVRFVNITILQKGGDPQEGEIVLRASCTKPGSINSRGMTVGIESKEKTGEERSGQIIMISIPIIGGIILTAIIVIVMKKFEKKRS
ncbi:MAG: hypothetical protein KAH57_09405 [Thermoplasmata archaeon]|nr:hypothetical protein [Thermoplasmata archaeon]